MAARTTDENVRLIIESDETITDLSPFIEMANQLVTECCENAGYDGERLEYIERLLAAHFYCLRDTRSKSERAASVAQTVDTKLGLFFEHTHHGQMALVMDTEGGLAALQRATESGGRTAIGVTWLGKEEDED